MLRRKPQPATVMTMKNTTSLNISVAESEAKLMLVPAIRSLVVKQHLHS
jgi:hypothetical protein